jgi:hypothetical protein
VKALKVEEIWRPGSSKTIVLFGSRWRQVLPFPSHLFIHSPPFSVGLWGLGLFEDCCWRNNVGSWQQKEEESTVAASFSSPSVSRRRFLRRDDLLQQQLAPLFSYSLLLLSISIHF